MRLLRHLAALALCAAPLAAQQLDSATVAAFRWRNIGPANMGGRITDVQGIPWPSRTFYVATAGGGLFKTTNAGTTFRAVLDTAHVSSGCMIAIAPSDTNVVYYGTGEPNSRNSMSPGAGLWKSADGGKSWKYMGLKETQHIGRIVVHPRDPNTVYVAALGAAWTSNPDRGLYKTTDGGATWTKIKFISDKAGFVDVALDPRNPDVVWAASYERARGPYFLQSGGPGSALWKSTDAGKTFVEVRGNGFPETTKGRIGIAISLSNPDVMYAMVEADTAANPVKDPKIKSQKSPTGLYRSADGGNKWIKTNDEDTRPFYYSQVRVTPDKPDRVYWSSTPVKVSNDGGFTAMNATQGIHVDHHAMWIDPKDPSHLIVGDDGGVSQSWDGGGNYEFLNIVAIGQFYNVSFDNQVPYRVCGGLQDNGSWCGPSRRQRGSITNAMWHQVGGGDGFVTAQNPDDPNFIFSESQGGNIGRMNFATGERTPLRKPQWRPTFLQWEDSIVVTRGDTIKPLSKDAKKRIDAFRARQVADSAAMDLRWNWNTPYFISRHNSGTMYFGANRVLKSTKMGDDMYFISNDLTSRDTMKIRVSTKTTGGITVDATGAETYGTIVSLNESPRHAGWLYAGTDDGHVWMTKDDGGAWTDLTGRFPGVPAGTYVSRIEPSYASDDVFYVSFDNHRNGDFTPYLFATNDGGKTFTSIVNDLPKGSVDFVHVVREDPHNPNLLFAGTEIGAFVSMDKGKSWAKFTTGLPTTPVHDLQIHPRDGELIAATHGRSIWIVDIHALEQVNTAVLAKATHLFTPKTAFEYGESPVNGGDNGHKQFEGQSPAFGAEFTYRLAKSATGVRVVVQDAAGDTLFAQNGGGAAGINRVTWNLRGRPAAPVAVALSPAAVRDSLVMERKMNFTLDSLEKEGTVPKVMLDRVRAALKSPEGLMGLVQQFMGAFGGGRAGAGPVRFVERPGEQAAAAGGRGGRAGGAGGEGAAAAADAPPDMGAMSGLFRAFQGYGDRLFTQGRGQPSLVETGTYKVSLVIGGKVEQTQPLRVERVSGGASGLGGLFEER
ncbi:MAG: hypothetical protein HY059_07635 [Proteobacteria bacterium]|nr:hypothetical protein [Pseudomonadota bacterium]